MTHPVRLPRILMPRPDLDLSKWAVIACDQYTSQPDYWEAVDKAVGDAPSTLRLTLPEIYLEQPDVAARTARIHAEMKRYLDEGLLTEYAPGAMLVERRTTAGTRRGVVLAFDLEAYEFSTHSQSLIRPTEKTVVERIPPRLAVRDGAPIELPHIMLLIDDPDRAILEPLFSQTDALDCAYDTELLAGGGHLTGWFLPEGDATDRLLAGLEGLCDRETFNRKYGLTGEPAVLPFAVGDGNHSMATAKTAWEKLKPTLSEAERADHPARFVLAEVVNIHDESLEIEGIHRVLFGAEEAEFLDHAQSFCAAHGASCGLCADGEAPAGSQTFPFFTPTDGHVFYVQNAPWALPVATLQNLLDAYLEAHPDARIDYIHGVDVVRQLSAQEGNLGFLLPDPAKEDLFRGVILDGVLPRKTFSMGEAHEKRYYMEARRITR